jgi:nucleoside-diphosphate-sugar epimerase
MGLPELMDGSQESPPNGSAAIIGAGGFIGARLAARLAEDAFTVSTFTRDTPFLGRRGEAEPELRRSEVVCYLATTINPAIAHNHPERARADLELFARLLDALSLLERPPLVMLPGSGGSVYHPEAPLPYSEHSPALPVTAYGKAKLRLERELLCRAGQVPGIVLRLSNVYGPGQRTGSGQGVVAYWLEAAAAGLPLRLYGDPRAVRDYVFIEDVVDAIRRVAMRYLSGRVLPEVLNIGSGQPTSLEELLTVVRSTVDGDITVDRQAGRPFDRHDVVLDVRRADSVLGWTCQVPLSAGIARTWDWHARTAERRSAGTTAGRS